MQVRFLQLYLQDKIQNIWREKMTDLFLLLIPIGVMLLSLGIKHTIRFAKTEIIYELPFLEKEGVFTLSHEGNYGLWLSGQQFRKAPLGEFGLSLINQETKQRIPLSASLMRTTVTGVKMARVKLYSFWAEAGTYSIALTGESGLRDRIGSAIANTIIKQPVDYSLFSIQVREDSPSYLMIGGILAIILGSAMIGLGSILPFVL